MEVPMVGKGAELIVKRRVVNRVLRELHVVVRALDSQHVFDARQELGVFERLRDVIVRAGSRALQSRFGVSRGGEKNHGHEAILGDRLDHLASVYPAQSWHVDIEHDEIDGLRAHRINGLLTVVRGDHGQALRPEQSREALAGRTIVVGNDHHRFWKWTGGPH